MTIIKLLADDQNLSGIAETKLASGNRKSVEIQVDFSAEWDGYNKTAVFYTERDSTVYEVLLTDGKCLIPSEVLSFPTMMYVGIRGVTVDAVKTTFLVRFRVDKGAPVGTGTAVEPTSDLYQQLLARFDSKLLPDVDESSNGKVLSVVDGKWIPVAGFAVDSELNETSENPIQNKAVTATFIQLAQALETMAPQLLPGVTETDEGKFLQVANGVWVAVDALPQMTALINAMFVPMTQAEYDALVTAGTVDASKYYMIVGEST